MKAFIQRVTKARVEVDKKNIGSITTGLVIFVGICEGDDKSDIMWMSNKVAGLRVFVDDKDKVNFNISQIGGEVLLISQFTLCADVSNGNRPSFTKAMPPNKARALFAELSTQLAKKDLVVKKGIFGANMQVFLQNDGPFTILLDSKIKS